MPLASNSWVMIKCRRPAAGDRARQTDRRYGFIQRRASRVRLSAGPPYIPKQPGFPLLTYGKRLVSLSHRYRRDGSP